jgi:competence protein ComEC
MLATIAAVWLVGLAAGTLLAPGLWQAIVALGALVLGILVTAGASRQKRSSQSLRMAFCAPAVLATALAGLTAGPIPTNMPPPPPAGLARIEAVVERVDYGQGEDRARSVIQVVKGERVEDRQPFPTGIRLSVWPTPLPEGARVKLLAQVKPWAPLRNPSPHPPLPKSNEVQGRGWITASSAVQVLDHGPFYHDLFRLRAAVRRSLERTLSPEVSGLARALVLGDGSAIATADADVVRAAGLAHVLAVSGMHVTILIGLCVWLMARLLLFIPWLAKRFEMRRVAYALGIPLSLIYAAFAGSSPSAWRAALTASISWVLVACGLRPVVGATCSAAAVALGAVEPRWATDPSFMLSIVATAAVISVPQDNTEGLTGWLKAAFSITLRASLATAPIILWCFGSLPLIGLAANIVLVPIGELVMIPLAALHAAVAFIAHSVAPFTAIPFTVTAQAFIKACGAFAALPLKLPLPPPDVAQGVILALLSFALLTLRSWRKRAILCGIALLLLGAQEVRLRAVQKPVGRLRVTFLDVGGGDSTLIDLPDGQLMVVDTGGQLTGQLDTGKKVLLPLLRARRREKIDIAVLTHPHPDHYGGLRSIIGELSVKELWDTGQAGAEGDWNKGKEMREAAELLHLARRRGVEVLGPAQLCGRTRWAGGARIEVISPCPAYDARYHVNDNSLVIRLDYQNRSFLFAGDIESEAEAALVTREAKLRADVLKVAHHGSATSSSASFLAAVRPKVAVISAEAFNRYGHPAEAVLNRLAHTGAQIARLDQKGGLMITVERGALAFE